MCNHHRTRHTEIKQTTNSFSPVLWTVFIDDRMVPLTFLNRLLQDKDGADFFLQCEWKELSGLKRDLEETLKVTLNQLQVIYTAALRQLATFPSQNPPATLTLFPSLIFFFFLSIPGPGSEQQAAAGVCQREGSGAGAAASHRIRSRATRHRSDQPSGTCQPLHTRYTPEKMQAESSKCTKNT